MEKMTNKKALTFVKENFELPEEVATKIDAMIATLDKKSANKKATARQKENIGLKEIVLSVLSEEGATVSEIQTKDERIAPSSGITNQRVSALLRQLIEENKVKKVADKKRMLYSLA